IKAASRRIIDISDCRVLIGVTDCNSVDRLLSERADMIVEGDNGRTLIRAIDRFLLSRQLTPGGTFLVGSSSAHLRAAEDTGLALFLWARDYFSRKTN
ncbi:MAG: hypothetical protein ACXWCQ_34645, partial [Burkholderiales bacterium]